MKMTRYSFFAGNRLSGDIERAVLPTVIYAHETAGLASSRALAIGWWAWGIGVIRTTIRDDSA